MIRPMAAFKSGSKIASRPRRHSARRSSSDMADHVIRRSTGTADDPIGPDQVGSCHVPFEHRGAFAMPVTVVVGAQWGDEGKAKVIDLLAADHTHVVRYQGGHNAGHTVVV